MTGSPMVRVDAHRLYEDLRTLLYERFRRSFLRQTGPIAPADTPRAAVESIASDFLLNRSKTRRKVQKIIDRHVKESTRPGSPSHRVYAPEMVKRMAVSIGREAWVRRYDGPIQMELKVQSSQVTLHQIHPPNGTIHAFAQPHLR